jgi:hypothetical protein
MSDDLIKEAPGYVHRRSPVAAWAKSLPADGEWYRFPEPLATANRATAMRYCTEVRTGRYTADGVQSPASKAWLYARKDPS